MTNKVTFISLLSMVLGMTLLNGCGDPSPTDPPAPINPAALNTANINLIFLVSEDLAYHSTEDINLTTANLTNRGLQRSLLMASFLQQDVLGSKPVTAIYALEPSTHLQTAAQYPDMVGLETIQQFALLNQITMSSGNNAPYTGNSFPVNVSYSSAAPLPENVAQPLIDCGSCQGLDFRDDHSDNEALVKAIATAKLPGFYVFSAPWETTSAMLANLNKLEGYNLTVPSAYAGPNYVYAISITPTGSASLVTYNAGLNPASTYPAPALPRDIGGPCQATPFHLKVTGGVGGAVVPAGINTDETVYLIRHAEAHPVPYFEDGNYVGAGQWRALELPNALQGKISPDMIYSIDPAQVTPGAESSEGDAYSYVRVSLTVEPYAIANGLPFYVSTDFELLAQNPPELATVASDHIFNGGRFSHHTLLVAWEHDHIPPTVNALLASYHGGQTVPNWPDKDYDTIWTVKLDHDGNVSVDNNLCEGINSAALPVAAPQF